MAPKIIRDNLQNITVRAGHVAKVNVEAIGEPPPKLTWFFQGKELEKSPAVKVDEEDYKSFLVIGSVTRKHSGKYTIKAENSSGKDEETIDILVLGKGASLSASRRRPCSGFSKADACGWGWKTRNLLFSRSTVDRKYRNMVLCNI